MLEGQSIFSLRRALLLENLEVYVWETFEGAPRPRPGQWPLWPSFNSVTSTNCRQKKSIRYLFEHLPRWVPFLFSHYYHFLQRFLNSHQLFFTKNSKFNISVLKNSGGKKQNKNNFEENVVLAMIAQCILFAGSFSMTRYHWVFE